MPKHVLSFKHLIASSSSTSYQTRENRQRSVNDLIASARVHRPVLRDPSSVSRTGDNVAEAWMPGPLASAVASTSLPPTEGDHAVHPAELLRREHVSLRQASRTVAGPAPPPSWRRPSGSGTRSRHGQGIGEGRGPQIPATSRQLLRAGELFPPTAQHRPSPMVGASRLLEHCLYTVLRHLHDSTPVQLDEPQTPASTPETASAQPTGTITLGKLLEANLCYLDPHIKLSLLLLSSVQPEASPSRLADSSLRSILSVPPTDPPDPPASPLGQPATGVGTAEAEDWEEVEMDAPELHHLPLTAHPAPTAILREVSTFSTLALTSLNLAFSHIADLERLVNILPAALRDLGLAGCRLKQAPEELKRGWVMLGRKLLVLQMLDLSFLSAEQLDFPALLLPPAQRLPSLRRLGMRRGAVDNDQPSSSQLPQADPSANQRQTMSKPPSSDPEGTGSSDRLRTSLTAVLRTPTRRYVDIMWD